MKNCITIPKSIGNCFGNKSKIINFERDCQRTLRLIDEALVNANNIKFGWELNFLSDRKYFSYEYLIYYVFDIFDDCVIVSSCERGKKDLLAIFDSSSTAAKYFVREVSEGSVEIDWSKHLDMLEEPSLVRKIIDKLK